MTRVVARLTEPDNSGIVGGGARLGDQQHCCMLVGRLFAPCLLVALLVSACEPANPCRNNSDCVLRAADGSPTDMRAGVCTMRGFCRRECEEHTDCPCGSFCASTCGLCMRNDGLGSATCFGHDNSYSDGELLGLCGHQAAPATNDRAECPTDVEPPRCERVDAGAPTDGAAAGDGAVDAGAGDDAGMDGDAGAEDAGAAADAGTDSDAGAADDSGAAADGG